jgi:shikimate dehydrogenase
MGPATETTRHRVGLIGAHLDASLSPQLHEREAEALGLDYGYERIDIHRLGVPAARIGELLRAAGWLGFRGVNVTHPCKREVLGHIDQLSPEAEHLGAVNAVVFDRGTAVGHNTDWRGFQQDLVRRLPDVAIDRVVLLGAGGAGAATAFAVLSLGAGRLLIYDAHRFRAAALARTLCLRFGPGRASACASMADELARADGLIHTTPTGMPTQPGFPLPPNFLHGGLWVADVVYTPLETELLRHARALGCRTLDGGGMAVFQAALSFELFTGLRPNTERMLAHFAELTERAPALSAGSGRR